jgi:NAD(P)-dependent dehydrogenase (short-subunit alcohol dehydrogenase family)
VAGRMEGKKAVVSGAGQLPHELQGNGRAIALTFAREGAEVVCADMYEERAQETVDEIEANGGKAHVVVADISNPDDCARLIAEAHQAMGRIDTLVNNVGVNLNDGTPESLTVEGWTNIMNINLRGTWLVSKAVIPIMREQGGGNITNISSVGSRTGGGTLSAYAISKAGVNELSHVLAVNYANDGIRCNTVLPSWIMTPHSMEGLIESGVAKTEDDVRALANRSIPLGKPGTAQDVANAVLWLSSEESRMVTGLEVPVDGGTLIMVGRYTKPGA